MSEIISPEFYQNGVYYPATEHQPKCSGKETYYEVIRVMNGRPLFLSDHLKRMASSVRDEKPLNITQELFSSVVKAFLERHPFDNGNIKVMICFENKNRAVFSVVVYRVRHRYPKQEAYEKGVVVKTSLLQRENPTVKKWNQSLKRKASAIVDQTGIYEVLLCDDNENITEGSRSNIFFISGGELITAPFADVLPGITRQKVIDISRKMNVVVDYRLMNIRSLNSFDGVFITGTSPKVLPIRQIDNYHYPVDLPLMREIMNRYDQLMVKETSS